MSRLWECYCCKTVYKYSKCPARCYKCNEVIFMELKKPANVFDAMYPEPDEEFAAYLHEPDPPDDLL